METVRRYSSVLGEFKKFILRGNVVDLAVGVVIGAAFTAVVNSIVKNLITPLIAATFGSHHLTSSTFVWRSNTFGYGDVINAFITFLIVAAVVFFVVVKPVNALVELDKRRTQSEEPTDKKCPFCLSTISVKATRCKFCTSKLEGKANAA